MLRKLPLILLLLLFVSSTTFAAFAAPATPVVPEAEPALVAAFAADGETMTMDDFLALTPKKVREQTGERMGFKKALGLKLAQRAIKKQMRKAKKAGLAEDAGGDKNQLVALLLAIFLGGLGIHSFYMGYVGKGIAQIALLLTSFLIIPGILLFAWLIYDIIRIATGSAQPKNGTWNPGL